MGGEIQLSYLDSRDRSEPGVSYSTFQQRYSLGLSSFLLDPRLLAYSLGVSFQDANVDFRGSDGGLADYEHSDLGYNLSGTFLPYGTIPVTLYANRQTSDMGSTTFSNLPFRVTSDAVGARASIRRSSWPTINMFAEKATLVSDQAEDKRDEDRRTAGIDFKHKLAGWDTAGDYRWEDVESNLAGVSENKVHTANLNAEKAFSEAARVQFLSHYRQDNFLDLLTATGGLFLKQSPRQDAQATYGFSQINYGTTTVRNHNLAAGTTYRVKPYWAVLSGITATWTDSPEASSDTETLRLGTTLAVPAGPLDLTGGYSLSYGLQHTPQGGGGVLSHALNLGAATRGWSRLQLGAGYSASFDESSVGDGYSRWDQTARVTAAATPTASLSIHAEGDVSAGSQAYPTERREYTRRAVSSGLDYGIGWAVLTVRGGYSRQDTDGALSGQTFGEARAKLFVARGLDLSGSVRREWNDYTDGGRVTTQVESLLSYRIRLVTLAAEYRLYLDDYPQSRSGRESFYFKMSRAL
ncbi:MAG: hypothetical protein A2V83_01135 [Nitrospirae bacterium RBG_16_64_22]|nr:MAG: hypothetical protein A2V83_01135 [Nitrospirae bacterium RBG_16_64_22]